MFRATLPAVNSARGTLPVPDFHQEATFSMARPVYGRDRKLQTRMATTMFGLGLLYVIGFGALTFIVGTSSVILWIVIGAALLVSQVFLSDKIALASAGARIVSPEEAPELHAVVDRLCMTASLPKPRVALIPSDMPNAFATGRSQKHAAVAVTEGLIRRLEPRELEGVIAHELTHIRNRDVVVMTVASFFALVAGIITRMFFFFGIGGGDEEDRNSGIAILIAIAVSIAVYILSFILIRALSRYREFAADRGSAVITKAPSQLASALVKISGDIGRIPQRDLRAAEGMAQFYIVPPRVKNSISGLFATHPPLEARLEQLKRLSAELEGI
jgi:heat shock protein HtpX